MKFTLVLDHGLEVKKSSDAIPRIGEEVIIKVNSEVVRASVWQVIHFLESSVIKVYVR